MTARNAKNTKRKEERGGTATEGTKNTKKKGEGNREAGYSLRGPLPDNMGRKSVDL